MSLKRIKPIRLLSDPKPRPAGWQIVEWMGHVITAKALIIEDANNAVGVAGKIICPKCGGRMSYSIAAGNGHVAARCLTEGCLKFME